MPTCHPADPIDVVVLTWTRRSPLGRLHHEVVNGRLDWKQHIATAHGKPGSGDGRSGRAQVAKSGDDSRRRVGDRFARPEVADVNAEPNRMTFDVGPRGAAGG
jgi:hypothetical protein